MFKERTRPAPSNEQREPSIIKQSPNFCRETEKKKTMFEGFDSDEYYYFNL